MLTDIKALMPETPTLMDGTANVEDVLAAVQVEIFEDWERSWKASMMARINKLQQLIPKKYRTKTFENFNSEAQKTAYEKAEAYCVSLLSGELEDADRPSLLMLGDPGTGKTHLAAAITNAALEGGKKAVFGTWDDHIDRIKDSWNDPEDDYEEEIKTVDLLIIDDLYDYGQGSWEQREMFKIINSRTADGLPIVITTNLSGKQIEAAFGARIASRLKGSCRCIGYMTGRDYREYRG